MVVAAQGQPRRPVRLRVLMPQGDLPHWVGELLWELDHSAAVDLHLHRLAVSTTGSSHLSFMAERMKRSLVALAPWVPDLARRQRLEHWQNRILPVCDIALCLGVLLPHDSSEWGDAATHWLLLGGDGHALCPYFPLLQAMTNGQGLHLALRYRPSGLQGSLWYPQRQIRVGADQDYGAAVTLLAETAARLVNQAMVDWSLSRQNPTHPQDTALVVYPPVAVASPWWCVQQGRWRSHLARLNRRVFNEYWRIGVIDAPIHTLLDPANQPDIRWLTRPSSAGYWADPFGQPGDTSRLACEYFDERSGVGHLEVIHLGDQINPTERHRLPVGDGQHASFPNVFEMEGRHFGIAETIASRECVLHEVDATGQWHRLHVLLRDVAAADPALFAWEGRYWLAYTDTDRGQLDNLCLQYADSLEGPWLPHANNPVKVDVTSARMAGKTFRYQGQLFRPAQDCLRTYGGAVVLHRIDTLTPTAYSETLVRRVSPDLLGSCPDGLHTLNAWGDRTLVDGKWHGINLVATWRNLRRRLPWVSGASGASRQHVSANSGEQGKPPSVLVYIPHLRTGGGEISMLSLAAGLAEAGCQVELVVHSIQHSRVDIAAQRQAH